MLSLIHISIDYAGVYAQGYALWKSGFHYWFEQEEIDAVKVIKGPLAGLEGELVMIGGKSKVAVRLDMLGCAHVDMPIGYVERINF